MSSSACIVALVVLALCTCNCQLENDVVIPEAPAYALYKIPVHKNSIKTALAASTARADLDSDALQAGGGEPDELPCYGANKDMVSQAGGGLVSWGSHKYVSPCRIGTQPYHASPPPLVKAAGHQIEPIADYPENYPKQHLASTITMQQWQTQLSRIMTNEMFYALVAPDKKVASKKLGNMFHTLGDSFSASHVVRTNAQQRDTGGTCGILSCDGSRGQTTCKGRKCLCKVGFTAVGGKCVKMAGSRQAICEALTVKVAISMDVVNWSRHSGADAVDDDNLYDCLVYFQTLVMNIWHTHRKTVQSQQVSKQDKLAAVNTAIDQLTTEVLCKALKVEQPQAPAGGATAYYSSASGSTGTDQPIMPRGLLSAEDAKAQHRVWNDELIQFRATCKDGPPTDSYAHSFALPLSKCRKANTPVAVSYPSRHAQSMCLEPQQFHVTSDKLSQWSKTISETYLQPDAVE